MRKTWDRIRHAVGFEVVGLLIFAPLASWAFGYELHEMGVIGAVASLIATGWNYLYNVLFDKGMLRFTGQLRKSVRVRVLHAVLFELGLLVVFLPSVAGTWASAWSTRSSWTLPWPASTWSTRWCTTGCTTLSSRCLR